MEITLRPCPFCGRGEVTFNESTISHTVPHHRKCSLYHERSSERVGARIEEFIEKNKKGTLELPVVVTMRSWIGGNEPEIKSRFGHRMKPLDHVLS